MQSNSLSTHLECPICMDLFDEPVNLNCGHVLCKECAAELPYPRKCPTCRKGFKVNHLKVNYTFKSLIEQFKMAEKQREEEIIILEEAKKKKEERQKKLEETRKLCEEEEKRQKKLEAEKKLQQEKKIKEEKKLREEKEKQQKKLQQEKKIKEEKKLREENEKRQKKVKQEKKIKEGLFLRDFNHLAGSKVKERRKLPSEDSETPGKGKKRPRYTKHTLRKSMRRGQSIMPTLLSRSDEEQDDVIDLCDSDDDGDKEEETYDSTSTLAVVDLVTPEKKRKKKKENLETFLSEHEDVIKCPRYSCEFRFIDEEIKRMHNEGQIPFKCPKCTGVFCLNCRTFLDSCSCEGRSGHNSSLTFHSVFARILAKGL
jgi:hypothetical protein